MIRAIVMMLIVAQTAHGQWACSGGQCYQGGCVGGQCGVGQSYSYQSTYQGPFVQRQETQQWRASASASTSASSSTGKPNRSCVVIEISTNKDAKGESNTARVNGVIIFGVREDGGIATGYVLTCAHMLPGNWPNTTITNNDLTEFGKLLASNATLDAALFSFRTKREFSYMELLAEDPPVGTVLYTGGYVGGSFKHSSGPVGMYLGDFVYFRGTSVSGMSGGYVHDRTQLITILSQTSNPDGGSTYYNSGPSPSSLREWLIAEGYGFLFGVAPDETEPAPPVPQVEPEQPPRVDMSQLTVIQNTMVRIGEDVSQIKSDINNINSQLAAQQTTDTELQSQIDAINDAPKPVLMQGEQGEEGPPGKDAIVDYDKVVDEVIKKLPPVTANIQQGNGRIIQQKAYLGGKPFEFIFVPPKTESGSE